MRKLMVFNNVSLDGYFTGVNGDFSWAQDGAGDPEWAAFVENNAKGEGRLLFGRRTYELMASYWPTPMALRNDAVLAGRMNTLPKVVFSKTLNEASWNNTTLVKGDLILEVQKLKNQSDRDMVIFGSGTIIGPLTQAGLIDEYQFVVNPVVIGAGRAMFDGLKEKVPLKLAKSQTFKNGKVFLSYMPAK